RISEFLKPKVEEIFYKTAALYLIEGLHEKILTGKVFDKKTPWQHLKEIHKKAEEELSKGYRNPLWDTDYSWCFYPLKNGKILFYPYFDHNKVMEAFSKNIDSFGLKSYGYWDNTDVDEDCPEEEWEQRKIDWNEAMGKDGIFCQSTFSMS